MGKLNRPVLKLQRPVSVSKPKINKTDPDWYWHLITGGDNICYICGKPVKGRPHKFIGYHKLSGEKLKRHDRCEPGSANYNEKFKGYIEKSLQNVTPPGDKK